MTSTTSTTTLDDQMVNAEQICNDLSQTDLLLLDILLFPLMTDTLMDGHKFRSGLTEVTRMEHTKALQCRQQSVTY